MITQQQFHKQAEEILGRCIARFEKLSQEGVAIEQTNYVANTGLKQLVEELQKPVNGKLDSISLMKESHNLQFYLRAGASASQIRLRA